MTVVANKKKCSVVLYGLKIGVFVETVLKQSMKPLKRKSEFWDEEKASTLLNGTPVENLSIDL